MIEQANQPRADVPKAAGDDVLHIAFGVDSGYFRGMGVAITSILKYNPQRRFVFHVFAFTVSADSQRRLLALAERFDLDLRIHRLNEHMLDAFRRFPCFAQHSLGTFIRLLIPNLLQGTAHRVLYLDADLLCFGNLERITQVDLDHAIVAAAHDEQDTTVKTQVAALGLLQAEYFNAGVMWINVDNWVAHDIQTTALQQLSSRQLVFADQDALNIALNGQVVFIGNEWNWRYHLVDYISRGETRFERPDEVVFAHFTGPVKPWHDWCLHDAKTIFLEIQAQSTWDDMALDPPRSARELKLFSKSLMKQGRIVESIVWHIRYLYRRSRQVQVRR